MDTAKLDQPWKYGVIYKTYSQITLWQKIPTLFHFFRTWIVHVSYFVLSNARVSHILKSYILYLQMYGLCACTLHILRLQMHGFHSLCLQMHGFHSLCVQMHRFHSLGIPCGCTPHMRITCTLYYMTWKHTFCKPLDTMLWSELGKARVITKTISAFGILCVLHYSHA